MKISGVDIRPGNIIEYEGGIWRAVKIQHTQPGKGGAYMQVELEEPASTAARTTSVSARRRRSSACASTPRTSSSCIPRATRSTFMDKETYDQIDAAARPARRCGRLPAGRHGRGDGAL